jgi:protein-tyrosine phosphatase
MKVRPYWIPTAVGRLAILPRPRPHEWLADEVRGWAELGFGVAVSLLADDEITELGVAEEQQACQRAGIDFVRFPVPDRGVPASGGAWTVLVDGLATQLRRDRTVGIHCRGGIGRSGMLAVAVLVRLGMATEPAMEAVAKARGVAVPDTSEQTEWIRTWAS